MSSKNEEASMMHAVLARSNHNADKKPNTEARKARNNEETTEGNTHIGLVASPKNTVTKHAKLHPSNTG
jgi:hypothetical protein